ncbi:hypothetical protein SAMN06265218_104200 [Fodinibius sediminis]|uniref:Uncharacterized protein n=1 Tax=Fodinibius sediminis TaxID=1214077 RepID=A0A521BYZ2_9BACT|nr:hypothetical protein SAMN06265218_104200 [Fodinibius sediminis]
MNEILSNNNSIIDDIIFITDIKILTLTVFKMGLFVPEHTFNPFHLM